MSQRQWSRKCKTSVVEGAARKAARGSAVHKGKEMGQMQQR
jgi:hypothetical protein